MTLDLRKLATKYVWGKACIAECIVYDPAKRTKVSRRGLRAPSLSLS